MKNIWTRAWVTAAMLLVVAGCKGSGDAFSALSSFFGGSGNGDSSEIIITSAAEESVGSVSDAAATVHNPEPTSLALFGVGLAGLARSRRKRKTNA